MYHVSPTLSKCPTCPLLGLQRDSVGNTLVVLVGICEVPDDLSNMEICETGLQEMAFLTPSPPSPLRPDRHLCTPSYWGFRRRIMRVILIVIERHSQKRINYFTAFCLHYYVRPTS